MQAIHRYLFGDLYEWAGPLRTIDISKGGHLFAHNHIGNAASGIFKQLADEKNLAELDGTAFSGRLAHYLAELNALHPFREGNGRAQREFGGHLAQAAGYYIAWENVEQSAALAASIESFRGDPSKLAALIRAHLHKLES